MDTLSMETDSSIAAYAAPSHKEMTSAPEYPFVYKLKNRDNHTQDTNSSNDTSVEMVILLK